MFQQGNNNGGLYCEKHEFACVMFASIPSYKEFYMETVANHQGPRMYIISQISRGISVRRIISDWKNDNWSEKYTLILDNKDWSVSGFSMRLFVTLTSFSWVQPLNLWRKSKPSGAPTWLPLELTRNSMRIPFRFLLCNFSAT